MGMLGKAIGGFIGFMVGGPVGAAIGAAAGHYGFDANEENTANNQVEPFFVLLFSSVAKMAKVDGVINKEEIAAIERFMLHDLEFDPETRKLAISVMRAAKDNNISLEDYIREFAEFTHYDQQMGFHLINLFVDIGTADGELCREEIRVLHLVESYFRLPYGTVDELISGPENSEEELSECYELLDCTPDMTDAEIKSAYRTLCRKFHPDRIQAKDLPDEFIEFANNKLSKINEAYDTIMRERSIR